MSRMAATVGFESLPGGKKVLQKLKHFNWDWRCMKPWLHTNGQSYITVYDPAVGKDVNILTNAEATLTREAWIAWDDTLLRLAKENLTFYGAVSSRVPTYDVPGGPAKTVLMHQDMSDVDDAVVSMEPMVLSLRDRPVVDSKGIPLPLVHKDIQFGWRESLQSEGTPMNLIDAHKQLSMRRVLEMFEKMALGTVSAFSFGTFSLAGARTFANRLTYSLTDPTGAGWTPEVTVDDILTMRQNLVNNHYRGPYMLFISTGWDAYLDKDYSGAKGDNTLRMRIAGIKNISGVETVDFLTGYQMLMIQMTPDVVEPVNVMPVQIIEWEEAGGLEKHWKIIGSQLMRFRADQNNQTGILHAS